MKVISKTKTAEESASDLITSEQEDNLEANQYQKDLLKLLQNDFKFLEVVLGREIDLVREELLLKNNEERCTWLPNEKVALHVEIATLQRKLLLLDIFLRKCSHVLKQIIEKSELTAEEFKSVSDLKENIQAQFQEETSRDAFTNLPIEILDKIFSHITRKRDLCSLSLTKRILKEVVRDRLWNRPRFRKKMRPCDLQQLGDLPIKTLDTSSLNTEFNRANTLNYLRALNEMPHLTNVVIDSDIDSKWLELFKQLKLPITVHLSSLNVNETNIRAYVESFKHLGEYLNDISDINFGYKYCTSLLRLFTDLTLKQINTHDLALGAEPFELFVDVLKKMKHLRELIIGHSPDAHLLTIEDIVLLSNLPPDVTVTITDVSCLNIHHLNVSAVVDALSKIRKLHLRLENYWLRDSYYTEELFTFTLDEFKEFSKLPIHSLTTMMLDINNENVEEYIQVLAEMKMKRNVRIIEPESMAWFVSWDRIMEGLRKLPKPLCITERSV